MINEFLAAQVVQHPTEDKWYYVSTINRESGCYPGDTFSETIVFGWDKENQKRERGFFIRQATVRIVCGSIIGLSRGLRKWGWRVWGRGK